MSELLIASQLPAPVNEQLADALAMTSPEVRVVPTATGSPAGVPTQADILFAAPMRIRGQHVPDERPPGWPYGLRWVQLMSSGIDAYPHWLFDVPVTTARGSSADAIAEFALASVFAAAKQLPAVFVHEPVPIGATKRPRLAKVAGSTLGLVGFGAIGQALARRSVALGMRVLAVRRSAAPFGIDGVERAVDLADLFARSDHVVVAAPLNAETRGLVGTEVLAAAKPGLHLVNIARGGLIDQSALLQALDAGRIGLASLDVTDPEPLPAGHRLFSHPRVHITPHISGSSPDLFDNVLKIFLHNLEAFRNGRPFINLVDRRSLVASADGFA